MSHKGQRLPFGLISLRNLGKIHKIWEARPARIVTIMSVSEINIRIYFAWINSVIDAIIVCVVSSVGRALCNSVKKWELFLGSRGNTDVICFGALHRLCVWTDKAMPLFGLSHLKIWPLIWCPILLADPNWNIFSSQDLNNWGEMYREYKLHFTCSG